MRITLIVFVFLSGLAGAGLAAACEHAEVNGPGFGAAAGGLFVCLGLCLYSLTKLEIAEKQAARDGRRQKEN
jgi:hypothetical protein